MAAAWPSLPMLLRREQPAILLRASVLPVTTERGPAAAVGDPCSHSRSPRGCHEAPSPAPGAAQAVYPARAMDEAKLIEKLKLIEALFAGATTEAERMAAAEAK